jgi:hypothetical protein
MKTKSAKTLIREALSTAFDAYDLTSWSDEQQEDYSAATVMGVVAIAQGLQDINTTLMSILKKLGTDE